MEQSKPGFSPQQVAKLRQVIKAYTVQRDRWAAEKGNLRGFAAWFRHQLNRPGRAK